eukprot:gnl/Spiro4/25627_TR12767_c0_g1_i1.p1 gnl/Spiro4/25627_TR12767_c0_g1~~gnl/Spiro4/25627_TR12767_c0_g1_i1.p1  ORF type:complete len:245 (+),score=16.01 gnl/Spiro4/25627_TR12767_c0_g1_i1:42-737(+)
MHLPNLVRDPPFLSDSGDPLRARISFFLTLLFGLLVLLLASILWHGHIVKNAYGTCPPVSCPSSSPVVATRSGRDGAEGSAVATRNSHDGALLDSPVASTRTKGSVMGTSDGEAELELAARFVRCLSGCTFRRCGFIYKDYGEASPMPSPDKWSVNATTAYRVRVCGIHWWVTDIVARGSPTAESRRDCQQCLGCVDLLAGRDITEQTRAVFDQLISNYQALSWGRFAFAA